MAETVQTVQLRIAELAMEPELSTRAILRIVRGEGMSIGNDRGRAMVKLARGGELTAPQSKAVSIGGGKVRGKRIDGKPQGIMTTIAYKTTYKVSEVMGRSGYVKNEREIEVESSIRFQGEVSLKIQREAVRNDVLNRGMDKLENKIETAEDFAGKSETIQVKALLVEIRSTDIDFI